MSNNDSGEKFALDFILSSIPKIVSKAKGFIFIPVITKIIDQAAYGIWTNFAVGLTLVAGIASLSLGAATNRFLVDATKKRLREEYWAVIIVTISSSIVVAILLGIFQAPVATVAFGSQTRAHFVIILSGTLVFSLFTRQTIQFYRSQRQMGVFAGVQSVRSVGEIGAVTVAAIAFESIIEILLAYLLFHALLSLVVGVYVVIDIGVSRPDFSRIGQYVRFGVPLVITGMMYWIVNVSDRYLITYYHTVDVTGGYAVVYATASGLTIFSMAIGTVLFPDLSSLRKRNNIETYRRRLSNVLEYFFLLSLPAVVGLIVIADPLLRVLSSDSISEYTSLMYVLAPAILAYGVVNILLQALLADGQSHFAAIVWGSIAVLNLGANLILVPQYAALGASVATLASFLIGAIIVVVWKREDIIFPYYNLGKIFTISMIMGIAVAFIESVLRLPEEFALPVLIGLGIAIYGLLGFASGLLTKQDIAFMKRLIED